MEPSDKSATQWAPFSPSAATSNICWSARDPLCARRRDYGRIRHRVVGIPHLIIPIELLTSSSPSHFAFRISKLIFFPPPNAGHSQCAYPGDPPNGLIAPLKFFYDPGDFLTVQCRPGFVEHGVNGQPPERPKCLTDGNWSAQVSQCKSYEEV